MRNSAAVLITFIGFVVSPSHLLLADPSPGQITSSSVSEKLKIKGHLRLRAEGQEATDYANNRESFLFRLRPEIIYKADSNLDFVLVPQFAKTFGEPTWTSAPNTGVSTQQQTSGGTTDTPLVVHEAYASYRFVEDLEFKPGRQTLSYGDELVLGSLDWNNVGRSFDAIKIVYTSNFGTSDLFFSKLVETNSTSTGPGDMDIYGFYNSLNVLGDERSFDLYYLYQRNGSATPKETHLSALGIRTTGHLDSVDYRGEYTKEFGTALTDEINAYQADVEIGIRFDGSLKPRFGLEGFVVGSNYNQLYPTTHKWLGYADVLGRSNLTGGVAHLSVQLLEDISTNMDYHYFLRTDTDKALIRTNGTSFSNPLASNSRDVGTEIDLTVKWKVAQSATLSGGASYFQSGKYLTDQYGDINPVFYFTQIELRF